MKISHERYPVIQWSCAIVSRSIVESLGKRIRYLRRLKLGGVHQSIVYPRISGCTCSRLFACFVLLDSRDLHGLSLSPLSSLILPTDPGRFMRTQTELSLVDIEAVYESCRQRIAREGGTALSSIFFTCAARPDRVEV